MIVPALVLIAAAILLAAFSTMHFDYDNVREKYIFGAFSCSMMALCLSCIVCGLGGRHFTNTGAPAEWVSRMASAEIVIGGLLVPAAAVFGVMWLG